MKLSNLDGIQAVNKEEQQLTGGFDLAALLAAVTPFIEGGNFSNLGGSASASSGNPFFVTSTAVNFEVNSTDTSSFTGIAANASVVNPFA